MVEYKVGDDVSYGINADSYYAGKIVRITKKFIFVEKITVSLFITSPHSSPKLMYLR